MPGADSAGVPWDGRRFEHNTSSDDDGSAPPAVLAVLQEFAAGAATEADVVAVLRDSRVLVPLVTVAGDEGYTEAGLRVDKTQELSLVTVAGRDGRAVQPVFTSVAAMTHWNPLARPVPTPVANVAISAAGEGTDIVVVDPTNDTEFAVRRPALWAIARSLPWRPSYDDPEVLTAFMDAAEPEPSVVAVQLAPGDPGARLAGPELVVHLTLAPGLDSGALADLIARMQDRWAESELIADRVDSLAVRLASS